MANSKSKKGSVILRLMLFGFSVYLIVTLCGLCFEYSSYKSELDNRINVKEEKSSEIARLTSLLDGGSEKEIIEKAARDRLGYVYADEQVYVDISGN